MKWSSNGRVRTTRADAAPIIRTATCEDMISVSKCRLEIGDCMVPLTAGNITNLENVRIEESQ